MKNMSQFVSSLILGVSLMVSPMTQAQDEVLDQVAVIVNNGVVLKSEIDQLKRQIERDAETEGRSLPSDNALQVQIIDRLILRELQMQMARRAGVEISDAQLDQTLSRMAAEQNTTVDEMRETITSEGDSWEAFREDIREQIITGEVQRGAVQQRVYVAPQEIDNLVKMIDERNEDQIEYRLNHILIGVSDSSDSEAMDDARDRAEIVLRRINDGESFGDLAISSSSGQQALEGGDLGWMGINEMPTLFSEVVDGEPKGKVIGPLRSGVGFHILQVADTRGLELVEVEEVKARHILVRPSVILSEARAEEMLKEYYEAITSGEADFAELAEEHSADPGSAARGGELGWAPPSDYAPEFRNQVETLEVGVLSQPFKTQFGWHIVEVMDRRTQDATASSKQERAYQMIFSRKYREELDNWQQEIRNQAYIEQVIE